MSINRIHKKKADYSVIQNEGVHNDRTTTILPDFSTMQELGLSLKACGVYWTICYLQQHAGISHPTLNDLSSRSPDGRESTRLALKELRDKGVIPPANRFGNLKTVKTGWVYLIEAIGLGRFKVGVSRTLTNRASRLNKQSPVPLKIVTAIKSDDIYGLEAILHDRYASKRVHGEWFELSPKDVEEIQALGKEGDS